MAKPGLYKGSFLFDPDDPIYADHFPGKPVVPGSLIVLAFLTATAQWLPKTTPKGVKNFRFKRFISPGRYDYRIQRKNDSSLVCTLLDGQTALVTGSVTL